LNKILCVQMMSDIRDSLIVSHLFYVDQAKKKILCQFEDIEAEAKMEAAEWLSKRNIRVDTILDYDESFFEFEASITSGYIDQLTLMMHQTRLSVVAGMLFEWEKQLRTWLATEFKRFSLKKKEVDNVFKVNVKELGKLLDKHDWIVSDTPYFKKILACCCVVNAYKHGNGSSFIELRNQYPEYLYDPWNDSEFPTSLGVNYFNYLILFVSDRHIQEFSEAIIEFWKNVPDSAVNM